MVKNFFPDSTSDIFFIGPGSIVLWVRLSCTHSFFHYLPKHFHFFLLSCLQILGFTSYATRRNFVRLFRRLFWLSFLCVHTFFFSLPVTRFKKSVFQRILTRRLQTSAHFCAHEHITSSSQQAIRSKIGWVSHQPLHRFRCAAYIDVKKLGINIFSFSMIRVIFRGASYAA